MKKAFKYRLYPNRSQMEALDTMLETHRRLYNAALEERKSVYESEQRTVSYGEQSGHLKKARETNPFLAATNFSSTQATLRRLDRSFRAFFRRIKSGEAPGFPRFKGRDRFDTVEFPSYGDGCKLKENGRLYLQHIGHIKVKLHRPTAGTIKTVSVKRQCGKWYVVFVCDIGDAPEVIDNGAGVGIDLGLKSFLVTDSGESVSPPQHYRKAQKALRRASRALSRRATKGSGRRRKARQRVARLHEKVANQRRNFHHKTARNLVDSHSLVAVEALNVKGIARSRLAKSTHDAGWAQFMNILVSKAEEAGVRVIAVDPKNTTQACSACGAIPEVKKTLSDRVHSCPCGYVVDRDVNAAKNILTLGRSVQAQTSYRDAERVA